MSRDCKHGQLARSCCICELEKENEKLKAAYDEIKCALLSVYHDADYLEHVKKQYKSVGKEKIAIAKLVEPKAQIEKINKALKKCDEILNEQNKNTSEFED
jgi:predicted metallo-beta-lactamase superfamily hydrolase